METHVLPLNKFKVRWLLALCSGVSIVGLLSLYGGIPLIFTLNAVVGVVISAVVLLRGTELKLGNEGLEYRVFLEHHRYRWTEIEDFVMYGSDKFAFIGFRIVSNRPNRSRRILPNMYKIETDKLVALFEKYKKSSA